MKKLILLMIALITAPVWAQDSRDECRRGCVQIGTADMTGQIRSSSSEGSGFDAEGRRVRSGASTQGPTSNEERNAVFERYFDCLDRCKGK